MPSSSSSQVSGLCQCRQTTSTFTFTFYLQHHLTFTFLSKKDAKLLLGSQVSGWCQCRQTTGSWGGEAAFAAVTRPPRGRRVALPAPPLIPFFTPFFNPNFHLFFRQKSYTSSAGTMITTAGFPSDSIFYSFLTQIFTYFSDKSLTHPPRGQQVPLLAPPTPLLLFPKVPLFKCPKMGLWAPESKNVDHFFTPTSPQNDGTQICFVSFRAI